MIDSYLAQHDLQLSQAPEERGEEEPLAEEDSDRNRQEKIAFSVFKSLGIGYIVSFKTQVFLICTYFLLTVFAMCSAAIYLSAGTSKTVTQVHLDLTSIGNMDSSRPVCIQQYA